MSKMRWEYMIASVWFEPLEISDAYSDDGDEENISLKNEEVVQNIILLKPRKLSQNVFKHDMCE